MNEREYAIMFQVEEHHWWYVALHELIVRQVARAAGERRLTILDAGCGTGQLMRLLQPYGEVVGCDVSPLARDFCRQRGLDAFAADLNCADLGRERYDLITAIDVLYHRAIIEEAPVLERLWRALKPGGLLILNLPAGEMLRSAHDLAVHTRRRYRRSIFCRELQQAGFAVETASYRLGFLFLPIAALRLARRLLPGARDPRQVRSDLRLPHPLVNRLLLRLARVEIPRIERGAVACGTSLFITARKPQSWRVAAPAEGR